MDAGRGWRLNAKRVFKWLAEVAECGAGEDGMARRLLIAVAKGLPANLRQNKEYAARRRACVVRIGFGSDGARVMAMVCGSSYAGMNRFKFAGLALCRLSLLQQTPRSE